MLPIQPSHLTGVPAAPVVYVPGAKSKSAARQKPQPSESKPVGRSSVSQSESTRRTETPSRPQAPAFATCNIWEIPFARLDMNGAVNQIAALIRQGEPSHIITANLNYVMLHHQQYEIANVTRDAAMILADGQPIVWRSRAGDAPLPERVAGSEMIHHLARRAANSNWGIYFLGGAPGVAECCAKRLSESNPGLRISGVESPPFRELTTQEAEEQTLRIRNSGAQILLVAFGQPKGEQWIHERYRDLGIPVCIQLGASFDFIAGTAKRAPQGWQRLGGEWLYRMCSDPGRLFPRYSANALFLAKLMLKEFRQRSFPGQTMQAETESD